MERLKNIAQVIEDYVAGGLIFIGVTVIFYGVIMRYVLNSPKAWVDEVSQYIIIWGTLIGTSVALRNDHHIKVDMLFDRLPVRAQYYITLFAHVVGIVFSVFVFYNGLLLVLDKLSSMQRSTDVGIPLFIVYTILPLFGALLTIRFLLKLYQTAKHNGKDWMEQRVERMESNDNSPAF